MATGPDALPTFPQPIISNGYVLGGRNRGEQGGERAENYAAVI
jgi:hypothetical protein